MKLFISWSGQLSRQIAEALRDWLPSVLQTVEPYVSSEDISKGTRWSVDVSRELEAAEYGILCVTATNVDAPWLNFEAGALSKSFEEGRVSPFLFDIKPSNVTGPLLQFQFTVYDQADVLKLIESINAANEAPLASGMLSRAFKMWWPELQDKLDQARSKLAVAGQNKEVKRPLEEMVAELLDIARTDQKALYALSQRATRPSSLTTDLEALQRLVEGLVREDRLTSVEVVRAFHQTPSRRLRNWLDRLIYEVEPSSEDSLPARLASADPEPQDES